MGCNTGFLFAKHGKLPSHGTSYREPVLLYCLNTLVTVFYMCFGGWKGDEDLIDKNWQILQPFETESITQNK